MKTDLIEIFQTVRASMQPYETLGFNSRINSDNEYDLWSEKNVEVNGEKRTETHFADLKIEEGYVSFCVEPVDGDLENDAIFYPDLLKLLNGNCFRIDALDDSLNERIADALERVYKLFKQNEWV